LASAGDAVGGAVVIQGPSINVSMTNSIFGSNSAFSGVALSFGHFARGGGLAIENSPPGGHEALESYLSYLRIHNCKFEGNSAESGSLQQSGSFALGAPFGTAAPCQGGAVAAEGYVSVIIEDSFFSNNTCFGGDGGSIGGDALGAAVHISVPIDNVMRFQMPPITFSNTTFYGNQAVAGAAFRELTDRGGTRAFGGAVHVFLGLGVTAPLILRNCTFQLNSVLGGSFGTGRGGAVSLLSAGAAVERPVRLEKLIFLGNRAMGGYAYGGAVSLIGYLGGKAGAVVEDSLFDGNAAVGGVEGAELFFSINADVQYRIFIVNVAEGGAVYMASTRSPFWSSALQNAHFIRTHFFNNTASNTGLNYFEQIEFQQDASKGLVTGGPYT
jgi:hypothetical protein